MNLIYFGVHNNHSLIITILVSFKASNRGNLLLYEIKTVPVPFSYLNKGANSYGTVAVSKPYMAINDEYYIKLRIQELRMCKHTNYEYFSEEPFLVQHKPKHSFGGVIFFDFPKKTVKKLQTPLWF